MMKFILKCLLDMHQAKESILGLPMFVSQMRLAIVGMISLSYFTKMNKNEPILTFSYFHSVRLYGD